MSKSWEQMLAQRLFTERECVERERAAFMAGAKDCADSWSKIWTVSDQRNFEVYSVRRYPLPKEEK